MPDDRRWFPPTNCLLARGLPPGPRALSFFEVRAVMWKPGHTGGAIPPPLGGGRRAKRVGWGLRLTALALFVLGLILFGQGAYIHAKALLAQVLLERAFAATIAGGRDVKPWSWADTWPVARIEVKRLNASVIVLAGSSGQALAFGPGHVEQSAAPGERGIAVYSAHRDTHFAFLKHVAIGDEIAVTRGDGRTFRYRADRTSIARFDDSGLDPLADGHALVLSTCWPFDAATGGPLRYLLHATMIDGTSASLR
jgi:sortase A